MKKIAVGIIAIIFIFQFGYSKGNLVDYLNKQLEIIKEKGDLNAAVDYFFDTVWPYLESKNFTYENSTYDEKIAFLNIDYYFYSNRDAHLKYYSEIEKYDDLLKFILTCYYELEVNETDISKYLLNQLKFIKNNNKLTPEEKFIYFSNDIMKFLKTSNIIHRYEEKKYKQQRKLTKFEQVRLRNIFNYLNTKYPCLTVKMNKKWTKDLRNTYHNPWNYMLTHLFHRFPPIVVKGIIFSEHSITDKDLNNDCFSIFDNQTREGIKKSYYLFNFKIKNIYYSILDYDIFQKNDVISFFAPRYHKLPREPIRKVSGKEVILSLSYRLGFLFAGNYNIIAYASDFYVNWKGDKYENK